MEFIKTIKLAASHKWILVAQILADAPPPPQTVNVIAGIETLMQGYISPEPQFKKYGRGTQDSFLIIAKRQNYIL